MGCCRVVVEVGLLVLLVFHLTASVTISMKSQTIHQKTNTSVNVCDGPCSLVDAQVLNDVLAKNRDYQTRRPFPYIVHDGLFPASILAAIEQEIPDNPPAFNGCVANSSVCGKDENQFRKNGFNQNERMGPATREMFSFLRSHLFVRFLEELTGIDDLMPDQNYVGAGIHQTLPGGYLQVHADFNRYPLHNWHRRVNVFVFLNPNWEDSYGGHLELWDRAIQRCGPMIRPLLGRLVVFSSTDFSYHGHPLPLTAPPMRSRRSLALYYYSMERPQSECIQNDCALQHSTLWQTPLCRSCLDPKCRQFDHIV